MTAEIAATPRSTLSLASRDSDLEHRLANFLYQRHVPDGDCVRLDARGGVVVVSGELASQHAKWLCIECCRRVAGVVKIIDELKVAPAIVKFPSVVQPAVELKRFKMGRHGSTGRGNRRHSDVAARKPAALGPVATSQQSRLLAAA